MTPILGVMIETVASFLDQHMDGPYECFLVTGSTARGERAPDSDVDVIVLCQSVPQSIKRCVMHDGILYDLKIHDLETLLFELEFAENASYFAVLPIMVAKSVVHPENHPIGTMLKNKAQGMLEKGPKVTAERLLELRHDISNSYYTMVRETTTPAMQITVALHTFQTACMYLWLANGRYISGGKWQPRILPTFAPREYEALVEGLKTGMKTDDWEPFREALLLVIERDGGLLMEGYEVKAEPGRRKRFSIPLK